ncbi:hypothetical protein AVEN_141706-1 [Araneus ventricosus]|uniref:Uncharacterized protein n=1 Tax=Araneus ventricosus TaxID=182803 RepID=A0A4Y2JPX5_ARAVE|nr:hypothetical protein AVEN_141706-1 [Araneus ventricosus]
MYIKEPKCFLERIFQTINGWSLSGAAFTWHAKFIALWIKSHFSAALWPFTWLIWPLRVNCSLSLTEEWESFVSKSPGACKMAQTLLGLSSDSLIGSSV